MKKFFIILFIIGILLIGCSTGNEVTEVDRITQGGIVGIGIIKIGNERDFPEWSPTPEQREMSREELEEIWEKIYRH